MIIGEKQSFKERNQRPLRRNKTRRAKKVKQEESKGKKSKQVPAKEDEVKKETKSAKKSEKLSCIKIK